MRAGDLAAAEALNPTMLSRVLAHLEEAGLAARAADPGDGRATRAEATAGGPAADRAPARPARSALPGPPGGPARRPGGRADGRPAGARGAGRGPLITPSPVGTFAAAHGTPNYRRYFTGQAVSLVGTWMQTRRASRWLVLELTHSGTALGLVAAAQFLPVLLLAPYGGLLADRVDKRHCSWPPRPSLGLLALTLGAARRDRRGAAVDGRGAGRALRPGQRRRQPGPPVLRAGDGRPRPAAQRLSLNSVMVNAARAIGPGGGRRAHRHVGVGPCFLSTRRATPPCSSPWRWTRTRCTRAARGRAARPGARGACATWRRTPDLLVPLLMLGLVGTLAYEF